MKDLLKEAQRMGRHERQPHFNGVNRHKADSYFMAENADFFRAVGKADMGKRSSCSSNAVPRKRRPSWKGATHERV